MDTYKVIYNTESDGDIYAISIVDEPANGSYFIALSSQPKFEKIVLADKKKQILTGIVLIPDQMIYREFADGTPFNLVFEASTIERIAQDFLMKGYQRNTTFNHDDTKWLSGVSIVESWIVEDPSNDKLNALNFTDIKKGTWVVSMKLNDELWAEYIETGIAKGFSIDSFIKLEKTNLNKSKPSMKKNFLQKFVSLFSEANIKLSEAETSLGLLTADAFEMGYIVYDSSMNPVMSSTFDYEGMQYVTDETGAIVLIAPIQAAEDLDAMGDTKTEIEKVASDISKEVAQPDASIDIQALKDKIDILSASVEKLIAEKDAMAQTNMSLVKENEDLKSKAASTKIKSNVDLKNKPEKETALQVIQRLTSQTTNNKN